MAYLDSWAAPEHTPTVQAYLDSRPIPSGTIVDIPSIHFSLIGSVATASVRLSEVPSWYAPRQRLEIRHRWDGFPEVAFVGTVPDDGLNLTTMTLAAQGEMARAEAEVSDALGIAWSSKTELEIIEDCLTDCGIVAYDLQGDTITLGTIEDVTLTDGQGYGSKINEIDQCFEHQTFDCRDGVVRRRLFTGVPTSGVAFAFDESTNVVGEPNLERLTRGVRNRVVVRGHPDGEAGAGAYAARQADSSYVPDPPRYRVFNFQSSLIETNATADDPVAVRKMERYNRRPMQLRFRTPFNACLIPSMTISFASTKLARLGYTSPSNFCIVDLENSHTASGSWSDITAEGGVGDAGFATGRPPIAGFTFSILKKSVVIAAVTTVIYVVTCQSTTVDLDSPPSDVTLAWSNNKNADVGSEEFYSTWFTQAEIDDATVPAITLLATDGDANTDSITQEITDESPPTVIRQFFHAFYSRAEATSDGANWNEWTPSGGAHVLCTPPYAPGDPATAAGTGYFGLDDGRLVVTEDFLTSAPTLMHTFGSAVNCVWCNESDPERVLVGLENGEVWLTTDASSGAAATFTLLRTFTNPVVWVEESGFVIGQIRVCEGETEWISDNLLGGVYAGATWAGGTACKVALSEVAGNWACAIDAVGGEPVKEELGDAQVLPTNPTDVRAITTDIARDRVYALERDGDTYRKLEDDSWEARTAIPGATGVNHAVRDGDLADVIYACDQTAGLMESDDGMGSWLTMREGNGTTLQSMMVGYVSIPLVVPDLPITYRRVYALTNTLRFVWTENIWAETPVWQENSDGLPAGAGTWRRLRTIPGASDSRAYVSSNTVVYRNDALRTGGAWTAKLSQADVETALGLPAADQGFVMQDMRCTIADPGYLYVSWAYEHVGASRRGVSVSYDYGETWGHVVLLGPLLTTFYYSQSMGVSQYDPDVAYAGVLQHPARHRYLYKTTNGGVSWTQIAYDMGSGTHDEFNVFLPYNDNADDQRVFVVYGICISTDGGVNWTELQPSIYGAQLYFNDADWQIGYSLWPTGFAVFRTTDGFVSIASKSFPAGVEGNDLAYPATNYLYAGGLFDNTDPVVYTSTDEADSWVDRRGNLLALLGSAAIYQVTVDTTV